MRISGLPADSTLRSAHFRYVFDGPTLYLRFPEELRDTWPEGKQWAKYSSASAAPGARSFDQFFQSPQQQVAMLRSIAGASRETGVATVRGGESTHYEADVDLAGAAELEVEGASEPARIARRRAFQTMSARLRKETLPVEVWVGADGRVRRLLVRFDAAAAELTASTSLTLELYDFGTPVAVELPQAGEVADLSGKAQAS